MFTKKYNAHFGVNSKIGTSISSPAVQDGIMNCAEQIQLTEMRASKAPSHRPKHLWPSDLQGIVIYRFLTDSDEILDSIQS